MPLQRTIASSLGNASPVAMGCWPIAGITSLHVNDADSIATLRAAFDQGVTHFDTAHSYGFDGESERLIGEALGPRRNEIFLATKCGIAYDATKTRITDGRPPTLRRHCEVSLRRLRSEYVELLYLHAPDPKVPLVESAAELGRLKAQGKALEIGLSNATLAQICEFHAVCPLAAVQLKFNLLQREIEEDIVPWCQKTGIGVVVYWPLMKGLLAGSLARHHPFDPADPRLRYPIFQSPLWEANQDFVDALRGIATDLGRTVAQIAINWIIHRPGISAALCGAKRPAQIIENAGAMGWRLDTAALQEIELAYRRWQNKTRDTKIS